MVTFASGQRAVRFNVGAKLKVTILNVMIITVKISSSSDDGL